ncbi:MAG: UvrD-helicase domain-containing protein [Solirubrobacterales bacterium]|nr:UvrD-helicase domain-containing protein [Solirubrobacterales bacterium]
MALTAEQQRAIECEDHDILLQAGAGSGKTSTTVSRYERLLAEREPSAILVFTFTDKAAGELRERIRRLREASGRNFSMGSLWVGTFHSICARILRAHPVAAAVDPAFDVIDDVVASRLKESAYTVALQQTCESEEAITLLSRFNQNTLKIGIQAAYERLRAAGEFSPKLPDPPEPRPLEQIHLEMLRTALHTRGDDSLTNAPKQKIENLVTFLEATEPGDLRFEQLAGVDFYKNSKKMPELCEVVNRAKTELLSHEIGPEYWSLLSDLLSNYGNAYDGSKDRRGGLDFEDLQLKTLDLLLRRTDIAASYRDQFDEIMVDEFQDTNRLQMDLIDVLRGENTTLFTVGDEMQAIYGFRYADVELYRQRRAGVSYRLPADSERRAAGERDRVDFEVTTLPLSANFRSQSPVIGAVNELGEQFESLIEGLRTDEEPGGVTGGTRHDFEKLRVGWEPPAAGEAPPAPGVEILLTESKVWQDADLGPLAPKPSGDQYVVEGRGEHEAEALALARHIRAAVDGGMPPGDVVVLLRSKTRMWLFEAALKQVGLRPYVVGGTGFWETREGIDMRALLATVANPLDDEALTGALAGPACGLSTSALWLLGSRRKKDQPLWPQVEELAAGSDQEITEDDRRRAAEFVARVTDLRARQAGLSLSEIVQAIVSETGYDLVNLMRDPTGAGLANIRRVAEIAGEFEATEGRDLRGLIDWIDDSSRLDSEQAVATEDEESDVVRLMTIHKSKGLEFPMVCVADLGAPSKANSESVIWISPKNDDPGKFEVGLRLPEPGGDRLDLYDWEALRERARTDMTDEELRILHVALTRAESRLVLSGVADFDDIPDPTEASSFATRLTQVYGIDEFPGSIPVPAPEFLKPTAGVPAGSIEVFLNRPEAAEDLAEVTSAETLNPVDESTGNPPIERPELAVFPAVPLSFSALEFFRQCPARFYATRVLKLDTFGREDRAGRLMPLDPELEDRREFDATDFGDAVHELLELMPSRRWIQPGDSTIGSTLEAHGVPGAEPVDLARQMIEGFLSSKLREEVAAAGRVDAEPAFLLDMNGVMIRGFLDLLVRDPSRPLVIDYKTNLLDERSPTGLMEKYGLQRDLYALAVSRALGTDEVDTAFVFLRAPDDPVRVLYDRARLDEAEDSIAGLLDDIAAGRYLGGPQANHQPCGECWACETLGVQKGTSG